jgi:hypothetical protein
MPRSSAIRAAAIVAAVLLLVIGWYLGSPLFVRTTVYEPLPTAAALSFPPAITPTVTGLSTTPPPTTQTTFSHRGLLQYVDALHNGTGSVALGVTSFCCPVGDRYFLRFEDVAMTNAPDVHVYLSPDRGGQWNEATSKYVGALKATNGSFNYDVDPSDAGLYKSVIVWCRAFSVLVTWADLDRV